MKGHKEIPMCGYSARVVEILKSYGVEFATRNVLDSDQLRSEIKQFSDWPTLPQLYVNKEFIGGCDIITQLHESGKLKALLEQ
ncbi:MAG: Glutaredoxin 4 [Chlamydiia bacterium]|nr:Glutaredoxin 4 [Chlamydiia bacterium]MCH9624133.1 Glutaredoxin 4 [Chlamydiia bacterium]